MSQLENVPCPQRGLIKRSRVSFCVLPSWFPALLFSRGERYLVWEQAALQLSSIPKTVKKRNWILIDIVFIFATHGAFWSSQNCPLADWKVNDLWLWKTPFAQVTSNHQCRRLFTFRQNGQKRRVWILHACVHLSSRSNAYSLRIQPLANSLTPLTGNQGHTQLRCPPCCLPKRSFYVS